MVAVNCLHWIDPQRRYSKPHELLRPGGALAVAGCRWARPADAEPFWADVQEDYRAAGLKAARRRLQIKSACCISRPRLRACLRR